MPEASWLPPVVTAALAIAMVAVAYALYVVSRSPEATPVAQARKAAGANAASASPASANTPSSTAGALAPSSLGLPVARELAAHAGAPVEAGFLGLVSHELRTPLTAMQLLLDRLNDSPAELPPRQRKIVDRLNVTAARLTDLVDSILYHARIENGRLVTNVEPFDLAALACTVADEYRPQAERKGLVVDTTNARDAVTIENDPKLLRLVIVNLVSNAVKFTDQGRITVSVDSRGSDRIVQVADSGSGIPVAELKRIFDPFQNVEATEHKHLPGVGLGLSLARQIVDTLGGEITVLSEPGNGSTFTVTLPAVARPHTARPRAQ